MSFTTNVLRRFGLAGLAPVAPSPHLLRRALIAHYSGINHRPDMGKRLRDENGMYYFAAGHPLW